jgi:hypothetical protein
MFKYLFLKALGKKTPKELKNEELANKVQHGATKFFAIINNLISRVGDEIVLIRKKCNNLKETNYKLGLSHIEKGNLADAGFRFTIIIRFWPDFKEAYYQKARVCMLQNDPQMAKLVIDKLLNKFPDYQSPEINDLIEKIDLAIKNENPNE